MAQGDRSPLWMIKPLHLLIWVLPSKIFGCGGWLDRLQNRCPGFRCTKRVYTHNGGRERGGPVHSLRTFPGGLWGPLKRLQRLSSSLQKGAPDFWGGQGYRSAVQDLRLPFMYTSGPSSMDL